MYLEEIWNAIVRVAEVVGGLVAAYLVVDFVSSVNQLISAKAKLLEAQAKRLKPSANESE